MPMFQVREPDRDFTATTRSQAALVTDTSGDQSTGREGRPGAGPEAEDAGRAGPRSPRAVPARRGPRGARGGAARLPPSGPAARPGVRPQGRAHRLRRGSRSARGRSRGRSRRHSMARRRGGGGRERPARHAGRWPVSGAARLRAGARGTAHLPRRRRARDAPAPLSLRACASASARAPPSPRLRLASGPPRPVPAPRACSEGAFGSAPGAYLGRAEGRGARSPAAGGRRTGICPEARVSIIPVPRQETRPLSVVLAASLVPFHSSLCSPVTWADAGGRPASRLAAAARPPVAPGAL